LRHEGITRTRPTGYPARADSPVAGGIVELHIRQHDLRRLAAHPARLGPWAPVIADLAHQAEHHKTLSGATPDDATGGRSPGRPMRRHTEIRDRTCTHPRCRMPAHATDGDHITPWAHGGPTHDNNISSACRHDHRLKHEGGWRVERLPSGELLWISRLGIPYPVPPPLIIEPLPDPIPGERPPPANIPPHDGDDTPTWREPPTPPAAPAEYPASNEHEEPPF
ncbi:MAG TPA: HNH endonuclease signature motif containing protein, partial [Streptosporangiaceae bacterium]